VGQSGQKEERQQQQGEDDERAPHLITVKNGQSGVLPSETKIQNVDLTKVPGDGQHARDYAGCPHLKEEGVHEGIKVRYSLDIALFERG
jgi:hypothetical protein